MVRWLCVLLMAALVPFMFTPAGIQAEWTWGAPSTTLLIAPPPVVVPGACTPAARPQLASMYKNPLKGSVKPARNMAAVAVRLLCHLRPLRAAAGPLRFVGRVLPVKFPLKLAGKVLPPWEK